MIKPYFLAFTSGDVRTQTGLAPTFVVWMSSSGTSLAPPAVSEIGGLGIYTFQYDVGYSQYIFFLADGATTGLGSNRYVNGTISPYTAMETTLGFTGSDIGSTSANPVTIMGHLRRQQEVFEGNQAYLQSTGVFQMYSRGSTLLAQKTISSNATGVTRV